MRLTVQSTSITEVAADWLIVGLWENEAPPPLDAKLDGLFAKLREQGDVTGKAKELTPLYQNPGIAAKRLLLVGLGPRDKADYASLLASTAAAAKMLSTKPTQRLAIVLPVGVLTPEVVLRACAQGFYQGSSTAGIRKSVSERTPAAEVCFVVPTVDASMQDSVKRAEIEGRATNLARELVNMPRRSRSVPAWSRAKPGWRFAFSMSRSCRPSV